MTTMRDAKRRRNPLDRIRAALLAYQPDESENAAKRLEERLAILLDELNVP